MEGRKTALDPSDGDSVRSVIAQAGWSRGPRALFRLRVPQGSRSTVKRPAVASRAGRQAFIGVRPFPFPRNQRHLGPVRGPRSIPGSTATERGRRGGKTLGLCFVTGAAGSQTTNDQGLLSSLPEPHP